MKAGERAIWLLPALAFFLYLPWLNAGYFSDDFLFYYNSPPAHLYQYFFGSVAVAHAYRPLEAIFLTVVQRHFEFQTWPIHVAAVCAHMILCGLTIAFAAQISDFVLWRKMLAAAFVLVTHVARPRRCWGTILSHRRRVRWLGFLSIFLFTAAFFDYKMDRRSRTSGMLFCSSVLCFLASLFFKETALGFSLILCLIAFAAAGTQRVSPSGIAPSRIGLTVRLLIPFAGAGAIYMAARIHAGGQVAAQDSYKLSLGLNVIRNLGLFAAGALSPVSSVTVSLATQEHATPILGITAVATMLVSIVILAGIVTLPRKANGRVAPRTCSPAALFPASPPSSCGSELYFYNAVPFRGPPVQPRTGLSLE